MLGAALQLPADDVQPALQQAAGALEAACGHGADDAAIEPLLADVSRQLAALLHALPETAAA